MRFFNLEVSAIRSPGAGQTPSAGNHEGLSVRLNPPGIYKNNKEIEIDSIERHHAIKAVVNPLHEKATGSAKETYAKMINYVDKNLLNRAVREVADNRMMIFGKPYDVPNAKNLAEEIKASIRSGDDKKAQGLIDSVANGTAGEPKKDFSQRIKQVLGGKDDPYQLHRFKATKVNSDVQIKSFTRTMAQVEEDLKFILRDGLVQGGNVKNYLDNMKKFLSASVGKDNADRILTKVLKESLAMHNQHHGHPAYIANSRPGKSSLDRDAVDWCKANEIDYKSVNSFSWSELGNMIMKPFQKMDDEVMTKWLVQKTDNQTKWFKETRNIEQDIKTSDVRMDPVFKFMIAKHGTEKLKEVIPDLTDIKIKKTMVLRAVKVANPTPANPQAFSENVIVGRSKTNGGFLVIEPGTGKIFEGETEDKAMEAYCRGANLETESVVSYRDSKNEIRDFPVTKSNLKRGVEVAYRLAVAAAVVSTVAATGGSATAVWVGVLSGLVVTGIDTADIVIRGANGEVLTKTDKAMVLIDLALTIALPGVAKALSGMKSGQKAERALQFLNDKEVCKGTNDFERIKNLKTTNPKEIIIEVDKAIKEAANKKPEIFTKQIKMKSKEIANPYGKKEFKTEKVFVQNADGSFAPLSSFRTQYNETKALKKYAGQIDQGKIISGKDFILSRDGVIKTEKGLPVFHAHPHIEIKTEFLKDQKYIGKEISEIFSQMGVSRADLVTAAKGDGNIRIIGKAEDGTYRAITLEIEFTGGRKILKRVSMGNVVFNKNANAVQEMTRSQFDKSFAHLPDDLRIPLKDLFFKKGGLTRDHMIEGQVHGLHVYAKSTALNKSGNGDRVFSVVNKNTGDCYIVFADGTAKGAPAAYHSTHTEKIIKETIKKASYHSDSELMEAIYNNFQKKPLNEAINTRLANEGSVSQFGILKITKGGQVTGLGAAEGGILVYDPIQNVVTKSKFSALTSPSAVYESIMPGRAKNNAIENVKNKTQLFDLSKGNVVFTGTDSIEDMVAYWPKGQARPKGLCKHYPFNDLEQSELIKISYQEYKKNPKVGFEKHLQKNAFDYVKQKIGPGYELGLYDDFSIGLIEKGHATDSGIQSKILSKVQVEDASKLVDLNAPDTIAFQ